MYHGWIKAVACGVGFAAVCLAGCQVQMGGQTLPSAYYLGDDVQYYAPGSEFSLSKEAAAQRAAQADVAVPAQQ